MSSKLQLVQLIHTHYTANFHEFQRGDIFKRDLAPPIMNTASESVQACLQSSEGIYDELLSSFVNLRRSGYNHPLAQSRRGTKRGLVFQESPVRTVSPTLPPYHAAYCPD